MYYHIKDEKQGHTLVNNNNHKSLDCIQEWLQDYNYRLNLVLDLESEVWQVWYFSGNSKPELLFNLKQRLSPESLSEVKDEVKRRDRKRNAVALDKEFSYYINGAYEEDQDMKVFKKLEEDRYTLKQRLAWKNGCLFLEGRD